MSKSRGLGGLGAGHGCVEVVVNGRLGGYRSAWPRWPEGSRLQAAGLHGAVLSRDREHTQRFVPARSSRLRGIVPRPLEMSEPVYPHGTPIRRGPDTLGWRLRGGPPRRRMPAGVQDRGHTSHPRPMQNPTDPADRTGTIGVEAFDAAYGVGLQASDDSSRGA